MFGWFKKSRSASIEDTIASLAEAGFRCKSTVAQQSVINEVAGSKESFAKSTEGILCIMGDKQLDPETFEPMPWLSDDVWHFDYEAIEDHGAYKPIVENCMRISGESLKLNDVGDYVDIEGQQAWIEFMRGGHKQRIELEVDNDWADPRLFVMLNGILEEDGSEKRFAQHDLGQDCLIICRTASGIAKANKLFGLKFHQVEG